MLVGHIMNIEQDGPRGFYTTIEAARLARVPTSTVRYWDSQGYVVSDWKYVDEDGRTQYGYDFEALLLLRMLKMMRDNHIGMSNAVLVLRHCVDRFGPPGPSWEDIAVFAFDGGDVFAYRANDPWETTAATRHGQKAAEELFGQEFHNLRHGADALLIPNEFLRFVEINPDVVDGAPVVRETHIKTAVLYAMAKLGRSTLDIVQNVYPFLTHVQVSKAIGFERSLANGD